MAKIVNWYVFLLYSDTSTFVIPNILWNVLYFFFYYIFTVIANCTDQLNYCLIQAMFNHVIVALWKSGPKLEV